MDDMDLQVPIVVMDIWYGDNFKPSSVIECFQANGIIQEDRSIVNRDHFFVIIEISKVAGLPWSDDSILWPADQDHLIEFQDAIPESR